MTYTTTFEWSFRVPDEYEDMKAFEETNKQGIETGRILKDETTSRVYFRLKTRYYTADEEAHDEAY